MKTDVSECQRFLLPLSFAQVEQSDIFRELAQWKITRQTGILRKTRSKSRSQEIGVNSMENELVASVDDEEHFQ